MNILQKVALSIITVLAMFYLGYVCGLNSARLNCTTDDECQQAYEHQLDVVEGNQK